MTKFTPILFSTPMVEANHAGRKNQTRRLDKALGFVNENPSHFKSHGIDDNGCALFEQIVDVQITPWIEPIKCRWAVGDVLWVKETFAIHTNLDGDFIRFTHKAKDPGNANPFRGPWRPSIHMPVEACRSWCVVEAIEAQRVQDISEEDAIGEGIEILRYYEPAPGVADAPIYRDYWRNDGSGYFSGTNSFNSLFGSINGPEILASNPWVWVVRYRHTTTPPDGWAEYVEQVKGRKKQ